MSERFPKSIRLRFKGQFQRLVREGNKQVGALVIINSCPSRCKRTRLGITVSKKFGNACKRNRFKRIVREAFRRTHKHLSSSLDIHIQPRQMAKEATSNEIALEIKEMMRY